MRLLVLFSVTLCVFSVAASSQDAIPSDPHQVVWMSPSTGPSGSMPLGNGDIGVNAWVEQNGDLLFYISKTDAWSENARLLKLGRVRVTLTPNPFTEGRPFRQVLDTRDGVMLVQAGPAEAPVSIRLWVDANYPAVRVQTECSQPIEQRVALEMWRTARRELSEEEMFSAYGLDESPDPVIVYPDTLVTGRENQVVWYHRNDRSIWPVTLRVQGMTEWVNKMPDPLLGRTFGGLIAGAGFVSDGDAALRAPAATDHEVAVYVLCEPNTRYAKWLRQLESIVDSDVDDWTPAWQAHRNWWRAFWDRSWIRVSGTVPPDPVAQNDLPLRIGAASNGSNGFIGAMRQVRLHNVALSADEIRDSEQLSTRGLVADWSAATPPENVEAVGDLALEDGAVVFNGNGWVQAPDAPALDFQLACTLDAWIRPGALPESGARIIDKCPAGVDEGYLLDTYPGNSLRFITGAGTLRHDANLAQGEWVRVTATYDAEEGRHRLYVNGEVVAEQISPRDMRVVNQGYVLQRFISACAGRGGSPIKFNGSIFTVDATVDGKALDADYRRWGGPYWFQNTRLAYWPMLAAGDFEMMRPLFEMYMDALPFAKARTRKYFNHPGAFFPETMYFWGAYANDNYGWDRTGLKDGEVINHYIRWYYSGALELLAMMLDYHAYTGDETFFQETLLPFADEILRFYDEHYPRDARGEIVLKPAQSLETWQNVINPLPPIAGLRYTLDRLLAYPVKTVTSPRIAFWRRLRSWTPPLPMKEVEEGQWALAPAMELLEGRGNVENPELYAVFPYRLFGLGQPGLDIGRRTFALREIKGNRGWQQDETQAAYLGLTEEARDGLLARFSEKDPGSRFPAFWGPNFDWVPDQDHGTNGLHALQRMLIQSNGKTILLFPAWPKEWDVEFRMRAPHDTIVEGVYRNGAVESLRVTPPEREADLVRLDPR